ncbi:MAG TPA: hypothetical protein VMT23_04075 [Candidatus Binatia bacterium]|nr:hypothetical protein [Candidatus Binatia bacterium]
MTALQQQPERSIPASAERFYSPDKPRLIGRLVLAQTDVVELPLDLDMIYQRTFESLQKSPNKATEWARTYGQLSVGAALDGQPTGFQLDAAAGFRPPRFAELQTARRYPLGSSLAATETDSDTAFVICDDGAERVEMSLIKALHMLDFAIVKGLLDPRMETDLPLVVAASPDELWKLAYDKGIDLRPYGNVRKMSDAPSVLGTVVPTSVLESSGITTYSLGGLRLRLVNPQNTLTVGERPKASAIGITTAKRPHLGHGFLLAKALSHNGDNEPVIVELNDHGPRVAQMVAALAKMKNLSLTEAVSMISSGQATIEEVEEAYRLRDSVPSSPQLPLDFSLKANNDYYRQLLAKLSQEDSQIETISNGELYDSLSDNLFGLSGALRLFGNSGMSMLGNTKTDQSVVIESAGRLTVVGIAAALCTKYALKFVDSPKSVDVNGQKVFTANGIEIDQVPGTGVLVDFEVASGTKGNAVPIDRLIERLEGSGLSAQDLLPVLRLMLDNAYFMEGDGGSLNPNYASVEASLRLFDKAAAQYAQDSGLVDLKKPLNLSKVGFTVARQTLATICGQISKSGRSSVGDWRKILAGLPELPVSPELLALVSDQSRLNEEAVPKPIMKDPGNIKTLQDFRSPKLAFVSDVLGRIAGEDLQRFCRTIEGTAFKDMMEAMGYEPEAAVPFCASLKNQKEIYATS